jgi:hypothetical protein
MDEHILLSAYEVDLDVLQRPDGIDQSGSNMNSVQDNIEENEWLPWLDSNCMPPNLPFIDGPLQDLILEPAGISIDEQGESILSMYGECSSSIQNGVLPPILLANQLFLGQIPPELKDLTPIEESMITLCQAISCIVQLKEDDGAVSDSINQRGLKGLGFATGNPQVWCISEQIIL